MKKKVLGILTFNRALNYGAVLQAYALKAVCEKLGYEVCTVNYLNNTPEKRPDPFRDFLSATNKKSAAFRLARAMLSLPGDRKRWVAFSRFRRDYLNETPPCATAEEVSALGCDVYIAGSDQIWNYNITGGRFDPVYFGRIPGQAQCLAYAASAQDTPFPLDKELEFKTMLESASVPIGIREQKLADYCAKLTGVRHPVVLDPTLLAGRDFLDALPQTGKPPHPYILIYQIDANPACDVSVKNLERRFGCRAYTMTVPRLGSIRGRKGAAGPEEFLTLLRNAEFLVTNSFHGIALSLLLEQDFFVYDNGGVMTRIDSLLSAVGLNHRKIRMVADIDPSQTIEFAPVRERLAALRRQSMDFLTAALKGIGSSTAAEPPAPFVLPPLLQRKKQDCSGCTACAELCPVSAISMQQDEEGFAYPAVNPAVCIRCGLCDRVCGFTPPVSRDAGHVLPQAFGIKHKNETTRLTSRSGAAFVAFSDHILSLGGVVYGAAMQEDLTVRHIRAATPAQRNRMKGAKYVQSDVSGIYAQVRQDLRRGLPVLFSGTPCQVSGLLAVLDAQQITRENLFCCDLVCHGVPSPALWQSYVSHVEKRYASPVREADFRDKSFGWDSHCESFVLENGKKIVSRDYTDLFYEHIMMRPSCHNCYFAGVTRAADLTLADFWGIEKHDPAFNDNKGVSLVLVSSERGGRLLNAVKPQLEWFACDVKDCMQPTLVKPTPVSGRRNAFWSDYRKMEFSPFLKKYTTPLAPIPRVKRRIKRLLYILGVRKHP